MNFLITPLDGVLTEITNDAAGAANTSQHIDLAANLYFGIGSTIFVAIVLTFVTAKLVEGRLGDWDPADAGEGIADGRRDARRDSRGRGAGPALRAVGDAGGARRRSRC